MLSALSRGSVVRFCLRCSGAAGSGESGVYLKLLGDLGSVQEQPGAETVHRTEGGCRNKTHQLNEGGETFPTQSSLRNDTNEADAPARLPYSTHHKLQVLPLCPGPPSLKPPRLTGEFLEFLEHLGVHGRRHHVLGGDVIVVGGPELLLQGLEVQGGQRRTGATLDTGEALQHLEGGGQKERVRRTGNSFLRLVLHAFKRRKRRLA